LAGQRDFGENYVQECGDKAKELPKDIQWHFIGPLQSNKVKQLASILNLYAVHTVASVKIADLLSKHLPPERQKLLNVFLQVNTSKEDSKSGLPPLSIESSKSSEELISLSRHIIRNCPKIHLLGVMTIGSFTESTSEGENEDFIRLRQTRNVLQDSLADEERWGVVDESDGKRLLLSMGMSSDFEEAIAQGSDVVRVGSSIFGTRSKKGG